MCFSASASFVAGAVLTSAGVVTLKQTKKPKEIPFALIPLLFGIQQIIEGFVWLSFGWALPWVNLVATYGFTFFSHILWPIFVPIAVFLIEPDARRKKIIMVCGALGLVAGFYSLLLMILFPVTSQINCHSVQYIFSSLGLPFFIHGALYLIATCLVCLVSSYRLVKLFGVAAIVFLIISYYFYTSTFASVWCFFSAILSLLIYLFFKQLRARKKKSFIIKNMNYGFIFDLDGLLVDTQLSFHAQAESIIFAEHGLSLKPEEVSERYAGISTRKIFNELLPEEDAESLINRKWQIMSQLVKANPPLALPGMLELGYWLKSKQVPIIIASASPAFWIELCLDRALAGGSFREVFENNFVSAEECKNGKPAPDVFLLAKDRLNIADKTIKWFVVGDGESDLMGGLAAEMDVLYLSSTNTNHDKNEHVKRFSNSLALAKYITELVDSK